MESVTSFAPLAAPIFGAAGRRIRSVNYEKGRLFLIFATSQSFTMADCARLRFRFEDLHSSKCLRLAWARTTLPVAVSLNRFATAFLVLLRAIDFGMGRGNYGVRTAEARGIFERWDFFYRAPFHSVPKHAIRS